MYIEQPATRCKAHNFYDNAFYRLSEINITSILTTSVLQHAELEAKQAALAETEQEREETTRQLLELRFRVTELEALSLDHDDMQAKVQTLGKQLSDKVRT